MESNMKKLFLLLILFITVPNSYPQSSYSKFNHYFGIQINAGYTFYDLSPLKDNFKAGVNSIAQSYDIPLEVQRLYPNNISWSGYLFWYFSPGLSLVFGPEFTSTKAFSRYKDYAGTLDLTSSFNQIYLSADIRKNFNNVRYLQPFIGAGLALTHVSYNYDAELTFNNEYAMYNNPYNSSNSDYSDVGYCTEICAGFDYNINIAVLEFIATYRYTWLEILKINPDTFNIRLGIQKGFFR
jgi:hypothetical protein